jgi:hypothetical protein
MVVASTDLECANVMMTRIREQLGKVQGLSGAGELEVSASAVPLAEAGPGQSLDAQVHKVAEAVNEIVRSVLGEAQRLSAATKT